MEKRRSFDTASLNYSLEIISWPIKRKRGERSLFVQEFIAPVIEIPTFLS